MNTVGNNPDAVQLGQPDGQSDRALARLTLQVREIGARLSSDEDDAPIPPGPAQAGAGVAPE